MVKAYTLILVHTPAGYLLINRQKPPYRGLWNALGGKIEVGETPLVGANRELLEETGLHDVTLRADGLVHWHVDGSLRGDLYLFSGDVADTDTWPQATREGVLALQSENWLLAADNLGIVPDLQALVPFWLRHERHTYRSDFQGEHFESLVIVDD